MTVDYKVEVQDLFDTLALSPQEQQDLMELTLREQEKIMALKQRWYEIGDDAQLLILAEMEQENVELQNLITQTDRSIKLLLGDERYLIFHQWLQTWWERHLQWIQQQSTIVPLEIQQLSRVVPLADALACREFATQYNPEKRNSIEVALPDKYVKFANRKWPIPEKYKKYYSNPPYRVSLYRWTPQKGYWVPNILVNEAGPWNVDDNYWDKPSPQAANSPRRLFTDLALCESEAYAAFSRNYNNGRDQFGRKVLNPAGIDLAPEVAKMLGLKPRENAWVWVFYNNLP